MTSTSSNSPTKTNRAIINRELKIDESKKELKDYLKTISMKFLKEPATIENLDKVYTDMLGTNREKNTKTNHE